MFDIIKNVITAGNYKLAEMQYKIKKLYIWDDLTEEQAHQLLEQAVCNASVEAERPEIPQMIMSLSERIIVLENRVKVLDNKEDNPALAEYPAWKPWDGISRNYQKGAIVSHNGQLWESIYEGQNVWEPGTVNDSFWIIFQK